MAELPQKIEQLENELEALQTQMNDSEFYAQSFEFTQPIIDKFADCEAQLELAYTRWDELEELQQS